MALNGTLRTFHLASLLQLFASERKTGVLQLKKLEDEIHIFFKDGIIVYASSTDKDLRLGRLLIAKGLLSEDQLRDSLRQAKVKGAKLGAVLVNRGYLSVKTLVEMLRYQVKELLYSLFFWKDGDFQFRDVPVNVEGKLITRMNTMEVILEASRRIDEWSVMRRHIKSDEMVFKISEGKHDKNEVKLNKEEWGILRFIDGKKTVTQLAEKSGNDGFTLYKSLCSLMLSGLIEEVAHTAKGESGPDLDYSIVVTVYDDVFKVILEDLTEQLGNRAFELFDECKAKLLPEHQGFFRDYMPRMTGAKDNNSATTGAMETLWRTDRKRAVLVDNLNTLLQLFLTKERDTLGTVLTKQTLEKADRSLAHVKEYQRESDQIKEIISRIESIIRGIVDNPEDKKTKSEGVLSFMKKKRNSGNN